MDEFKPKNFDIGIWKRLFSNIKEHKKTLFILIGLMIFVGFIDVILPLTTRYAIDNYIETNSLEGLEYFALAYLFLCIFQGLNVYIFIVLAGKIELGFVYKVRKVAFEHLQKLSLSYYDKTPIGWIMARMISDIRSIGSVMAWGLVDSTWAIFMLIAVVIIMFSMNVKLAIIALLVVPILVFVSIFFQKRILKWQRIVRRTNSKITGSFNEGIHGAKTSKTLVIEDDNISDFEDLTDSMYTSSIKVAIFSAAYMPLIAFLSAIGTVLIIWLGGNMVISDQITYGDLAAFFNYSVILAMPINFLARIITEVQRAQASAERIINLLDEKPDIEDRLEVQKKYGDILNPKTDSFDTILGNIEFKEVNFHYQKEEPILKEFNLNVKKGETIALVGETGSGKSTIINLICRFYEPISGKILIDGVDIQDRSLNWLHSNIGYVLQSPTLFSGTIEENIRYGNLAASYEDIEDASKLVNAHDFIISLKDGYQTKVGEDGSNLSVGQKQLISFARAIISKPALFILDEATSSIDTETEAQIQGAITKILKNRTSFIVAHRLSTIKNADRIIVIEDGLIKEKGSHNELIKKKGVYYKLYTNQFTS